MPRKAALRLDSGAVTRAEIARAHSAASARASRRNLPAKAEISGTSRTVAHVCQSASMRVRDDDARLMPRAHQRKREPKTEKHRHHDDAEADGKRGRFRDLHRHDV